ncbi:MAG: ferric reductase-like transmembrane domain-containing protein [Micrococcales bacterium]
MTSNYMFTEPNKKVVLGRKKLIRVARRQDLVEVFAWASAIAVVAMFLIDGGVKTVVDVPSALGSLSRLTALVGTDLLLIHMLLIARVPWIDRLYGLDKATEAHKKLGKPILYLVSAHFLASLIGFSMTDGKNVIDEFWYFMTGMQDMITAALALLAMILVVVTSINIARKRISYEAWWLVHLLGYASVLLAIPHQFSTGSDIAGKVWPTLFWVTLYIFVAGNIIWYRILSPIFASFYFDLRVAQATAESSDSTSVYISGRHLEKLGHKSGQFYILRVLTPKQWWRAHPFSISAAPNSRFVRFTIGNRGDDTALLQNVKPGTRVMLEGPYGVFTEDRRTREKVTLIAAGIGAPPIRALAESLAARPGDVNIIYRVRDSADAPLAAELEALARRRGFKLTLLEGKRGHANSWLPEDPSGLPDHARVTQIAPWVSESDVFVCGPAAWTKTVKKSLRKAGTPEHQIHAEEFAW